MTVVQRDLSSSDTMPFWDHVSLQASLSLRDFAQTVVEILPALAVPFLVAAAAALWARRTAPESLAAMTDGQGTPAVVLETLFFGLVGVGLGYLSFMTQNNIIVQITSSLVAALAILLQLLGHSLTQVAPPFSRVNILWAASAATLSFIVAARYFAVTFAASGTTQP